MPLCQVRDVTVHTGLEDGALCVIHSQMDKPVFEYESALLQLEQTMALQKDASRTVFPVIDGRLDTLFSCSLQFSGYLQFSLHHDVFWKNQ